MDNDLGAPSGPGSQASPEAGKPSSPSGEYPSRGYWHFTDEQARSAPWVTEEREPRWLTVKGTAMIDPDVFVATEFGRDRPPLWVLKNSGLVLGLGGSLSTTPPADWIYARPASAMSTGTAETLAAQGRSPASAVAKPDAQNNARSDQ